MDLGWFGVPGAPPSASTKTHAIMYCGSLLCGARIKPQSQFQRCRTGLDFRKVTLFVECGNCERIAFARMASNPPTEDKD